MDSDTRNAPNIMQPKKSGPPSEANLLLDKLLRTGFINARVLEVLPEQLRGDLANLTDKRQMLARLVQLELLTSYQADRIQNDNFQGMILGNYRVLGRLGGGKDGVVFRGEQRETGHKVAIKVLIPARDQDPKPMLRFFAERKTVAHLSHPGIVSALDIGESRSDDPDEPVLYYYVMELVPGLDLEQHVQRNGPMHPALACDMAYQVADALTEAHKHNLVHRDIKPSNIILTPEGRAMLLDFGVVRQFHSRQTVIGSLVGVLEWIAPEQLKDAHTVDIRADIYSLGCTLFWCLTAQSPNGLTRTPSTSQVSFQTQPREVRTVRSDISPGLDALVARMMALRPSDRFPDPRAVMAALIPFVSEKYALARASFAAR
jgi:putative two-component system response regulator